VARTAELPGAIAVVAAALARRLRRPQTIAAIRDARFAITLEETLFIGGLVLLSVLRVSTFGSSVSHTEQFMDMALMNASYHSASYPPFDPWMSGQSVNYYYFGYLSFATLTKLAGVIPSVGYNLALSTIFGLALAGAYSIVHALTRHLVWPLLAPLLVAAIGNWHALLWTLFHGSCANSTGDVFWSTFWHSTRVVGGGYTLANWACSSPAGSQEATINEYPLFSFVLGDLHPHVMALPFVLLVMALGVACLQADRRLRLERSPVAVGRLLLLAVAAGALFAVNSWDFPTYLGVVAACILANAYLLDERPDWWKEALAVVAVFVVASVVLFLPFYLGFHSVTHGIGRVTTPTDIYEFLQAFGLFALASALFVFVLSLLLQPAEEAVEDPVQVLASETGAVSAGPAGSSGQMSLLVTVALCAVAVAAILVHETVLLILVALGVSALVMLRRVLNTEEPNRADASALILVALGCAAVAITEVVYLRDSFDGSAMYRMNTIFKFYYQGWVLLGLAGAYGVFRIWTILRALYAPLYSWVAMAALAAGIAAGGYYTTLAFQAHPSDAAAKSLDGAGWMAVESPGDAAAVDWLRRHAPDGSVILEAVGTADSPGGDYSQAARVSTFTGLPTVMGWVGHEQQWRGNISEITTRSNDVQTIYTTGDVARATSLLRAYNVRYVVVGSIEQARYTKNLPRLNKFGTFMRPVFRSGLTTVYTWK
jgi:YYY domain-containing protein